MEEGNNVSSALLCVLCPDHENSSGYITLHRNVPTAVNDMKWALHLRPSGTTTHNSSQLHTYILRLWLAPPVTDTQACTPHRKYVAVDTFKMFTFEYMRWPHTLQNDYQRESLTKPKNLLEVLADLPAGQVTSNLKSCSLWASTSTKGAALKKIRDKPPKGWWINGVPAAKSGS